MKKIYLLLGSFLLIMGTNFVYGQKGLKLGGFALPQTTFLFNADLSNLDEDEYRPELFGGMAGGIVFGYNFSDNFGFRLNAIYSQEGGRHSIRQDIDSRYYYVRRQEYLKLPLMIGINSSPVNRKVLFSFYGGVQLDILSKAYDYNDNPTYIPPVPDNITHFPTTYETYEPINYSVVGDIGIDILLPPSNFALNLHLRGDYSLRDVEDKAETFRLTEGGSTRLENYWTNIRGTNSDSETFGLNVGILIGLTYTFAPAE